MLEQALEPLKAPRGAPAWTTAGPGGPIPVLLAPPV